MSEMLTIQKNFLFIISRIYFVSPFDYNKSSHIRTILACPFYCEFVPLSRGEFDAVNHPMKNGKLFAFLSSLRL